MNKTKIIALIILIFLLLSACTEVKTPETEVIETPEIEIIEIEETSVIEEVPIVEEPLVEVLPGEEPEDFVFGMLLVGPYNDMGWSQAHYDAGLYVEENVPNTKMIYIDTVNTADRPGTTPSQLAEELVGQGARLIIFNSDDMKDDAVEFTKRFPEIYVIHASGDSVWEKGENYTPLDNMVNVMGMMEYTKMIAGCNAALHTQTGAIGYVGPLINEETRRLVVAAQLGANYCWENYLGKNPEDLKFKVTWIGFWFNIPGFTEDPSQVAGEFVNSGFDVLISGIDTTEALVEASKATTEGKLTYAIPYDYIYACQEAPEVCLGSPYFNWGPAYSRHISSAMNRAWESAFEWLEPDWNNINDPDTSAVGFVTGEAMTLEAEETLAKFIEELSQGLTLWAGPLYFQDGTEFLTENQVATDVEIWYLPQLLQGIEGRSE